jgi:hypothetical protein
MHSGIGRYRAPCAIGAGLLPKDIFLGLPAMADTDDATGRGLFDQKRDAT